MPRPTLFDHPKFHRLVHILGIPEPQALGLLEYLWRVGYAAGNPVIGDELDIEIAAKWWGERGVLAQALLDSRLIDRIKAGKLKGQLQIHDLLDHAPDYVRSRFRMEAYRRRNRSEELRNGYSSPAPAPAPAPKEKEAPTELAQTGFAWSEPLQAAPDDPIICTFPTVGKGAKEWHLQQSKVDEYRESFPAVNVEQEVRCALQWCRDNPAKRKTATGMPAFLTRWLGRVQNNGRNGHTPAAKKDETVAQKIARIRGEQPCQ